MLNIVCHPLIDHKMTKLRDKDTGNKEFKELVEELAAIICYEATRHTETIMVDIETPVAKTQGKDIETKYAVVPILRAGQGMMSGVLKFLPMAKVGHVGIYRDHRTLKPIEYYTKLPQDISKREVFVVDPMVATGGSANTAITILKSRGAKKISVFCLVSCPEGVDFLLKNHPDINIYTTAHDEKLNEKGYIVPGLGDAGDRLYGTQ